MGLAGWLEEIAPTRQIGAEHLAEYSQRRLMHSLIKNWLGTWSLFSLAPTSLLVSSLKEKSSHADFVFHRPINELLSIAFASFQSPPLLGSFRPFELAELGTIRRREKFPVCELNSQI